MFFCQIVRKLRDFSFELTELLNVHFTRFECSFTSPLLRSASSTSLPTLVLSSDSLVRPVEMRTELLSIRAEKYNELEIRIYKRRRIFFKTSIIFKR